MDFYRFLCYHTSYPQRKELSYLAAIPIALPSVWLAALVLFAVAEAATVSLVSIWFAGGA